MALIPCPECGRQISTSASSCPGCGCPMGGVQPMPETKTPTAAEPKSESESVSQDPQLLEQLKNLNAQLCDGNRLVLMDNAADNLLAIATLCSKIVTRIDIIQMGEGRYRDRHFEQLQQFPNLRELTVDSRDLTDASFLFISNLQSLTKLVIKGGINDAFTERGLGKLTKLKNVQLIEMPKGWPGGWIGKREREAAQAKVKSMLEQALPDAVVVWNF